MKAGTESRAKVIAAVALGAAAVILLATQMSGWFGGSSSSAATPTRPAVSSSDPVPTPGIASQGRARGAKSDAAVARSMDPSLRLDLLRASEETKYEGTGRNIFRVFVEMPKAITPVVPQPQPAPGPTPYVPPPPPPINLIFYGFATPANGVKRIFLAKNEDVFIAKEGDIVDRRYKVVRISPNAVEILDVLSNNRQSIPLTQG